MKTNWNPMPGPQADFFATALEVDRNHALTGRTASFPLTPRQQKNRLRDKAAIALVDAPRARNTDPETSHIAARRVMVTGQLNQQQRRVAVKVRLNPGLTSAELAAHHAKLQGGTWEKYRSMFARRLPELDMIHVKRGEARICKVTDSKCMTWWPI